MGRLEDSKILDVLRDGRWGYRPHMVSPDEASVRFLTASVNMHRLYKCKHVGYFAHDRFEMLQYVPMSARTVLDVGCGEGAFAAHLKATRGITVWGVEPNTAAATVAAERLDRVVAESFESAACLGDAVFDCIVFNDVLEHMYDPWDVLRSVRGHLADGGVVVASIPSLQFFPVLWNLVVHGRWEYAPGGVLDATHIRFFTKCGVVSLFADAGFSVQRIEGINPQPLGRRYRLLNALLLHRLADMKYLQFAVVAAPKKVGLTR